MLSVLIDSLYLHKAIQSSGKVHTKISKVLVQGPARVGKTSVKSIILSMPYNSIASTGIAERPQVAVGDFSTQKFCQDERKRWKLVTDDNIIEMFLNDIKSLIKEDDAMKTHKNKEVVYNKQAQDDTYPSSSRETNDYNQHNNTQFNQEEVNINIEVAHDKSVQLPVLTMPNISQNPKQETGLPTEESGNHPTTSHALERKSSVKRLSEILSQITNISRTDKLTLHQNWLYFIDSGGQIQFQQILQAFIPCASILMLVISLADDLSSQSSTELQRNKDEKYIVSEHSLSIETLLKRLISMVTLSNQRKDMVSKDDYLSAAIRLPKQLKVITIATHRDKYDELLEEEKITENIVDKKRRLSRIFEMVPYNIRYQDISSNSIIYEVDGRKALEDEQTFDKEFNETINSIREELSKQAFEVDIPLTWYAYQILLRDEASKNCGVLKLKDCKSLGIELDLDEEEIKSALKFFHLLNSILHYPETVTDLVFIDPYSLIEVVNELMVFICKVRSGYYVGSGYRQLIEMANLGIISSDVFSEENNFPEFTKISKKFKSFKSDLLKIFELLLLATKLPSDEPSFDDKYFMPALLPLTDPLKVNPFSNSCNTPLLFYFKKGVAIGLFCAMIVRLLSSNDHSNAWLLDPICTKMYSNCVYLQNKANLHGGVCLIESTDCFEIHCEKREDQIEVKEVVESAILKIKKGIEFELAFFCPCNKQSRHPAILRSNGYEIYCSLPESKYTEDIQARDSPRTSWIWISLKINPGM